MWKENGKTKYFHYLWEIKYILINAKKHTSFIKMDACDYIKINSICSSKDTTKRVEKQAWSG
jgi:hypothetical protein